MATYRTNKKGFAKLATSAEVSRHMVRVVGAYWADDLRAAAPRVSGDYADSITTRAVTVNLGSRLRAGVEIAAESDHSAILEIGSDRMLVPPRPMTKLLDRIEDADPGQKRKGRG